MRQLPRFAPLRQAPRGRFRRTPPMIFAPVLALMALALALMAGQRIGVPAGLGGFAAGVAAALFLFAAIAYLAKLSRRPAVLGDELAVLPGRLGVDAGLVGLCLSGALLAGFAPLAGKLALIAGLLALAAVVVFDLARAGEHSAPAWQLRVTALLVAAAGAGMLGWPGLGRVLIWPGALAAVVLAALSLGQMRRRRMPVVLLPLMALHLAPVAAFGAAAAILDAPLQQQAYGLSLAGLILLPVFAWRAGTGLFLVLLTIPLSLAAWQFCALAAANPGNGLLGALALIILALAAGVSIPASFATLRDWAGGRLATRSNAAIA
ncbi:MAG: hypothetical protein Q4G26_03025 [Paracoccus sp. (in: a-proteobacteria)]|nr:hypothetical protein [Paracoccus sp. (in: a-proteobacteria)]